jgi:ubiquinol-cytochrome c reductase cytochrome c1 subunit
MKLSLSKSLIAAAALVGMTLAAAPASAERTAEHPHKVGYSFDGPFGKFDQGQLQRGYKVYKEVCSSCHSMNLLSFRDLGMKGGPFYSAEYKNPTENGFVKAIAADFEVDDIDTETGDVVKRKATPADHFPSPYANSYAAAAGNGGAVPPDLSVMAKARHGGANYIHSLLMGYRPAPAGLPITATQHYNPWFPGDLASSWDADPKNKGKPVPVGGLIAMPPPLHSEGQVTFDDGTKPTVDQQAKDVAAFIEWASDPKATERKQTGVQVLIYLLIFAGLTFLSYRRIWRNVDHH